MKIVEKYISPLVQSQFPDFYKDQGPLFILFVEEYYRWLEETNNASYDDAILDGNPNYHIRRLLEYKDIDLTDEVFLGYIKEKYLKGIQFDASVSKRALLKAANDIFRSKGSERSLDLFFKMVFGTRVEVYVPGEDILKPSDGTWVIPVYLELSVSQRTKNYVGKQVTGSLSGATAFVEYLITRNISGKIIDVVFLSGLKGNFQVGESLLDNPLIENAPKITGSLTTVDITNAGELFSVGERVRLLSARGTEGIARVDSVESVTGIVRFTLIDGGWGYSNTATVDVSDKVLSVSNVINSNTQITEFQKYEIVSQNLFSFALTDVTGELLNNSIIVNGNTSTPSESVAVLVQQSTSDLSTANLTLNQISSNVFSNTIVYEKNRALVYTDTTITLNVGDTVIQSNGSSNTARGVISTRDEVILLTTNTATIPSTNGIHVGTFIKQTSTGATGTVYATNRENLFTFTNVSHIAVSGVTGTFNNTSTINVYSNSTSTTLLGQFDPVNSQPGYQYLLVETNLTSNVRWSSSNSLVNFTAPSINTSIVIASDIGGKYSSFTDTTATANVIGSNTTALGLSQINNTFYGNGLTRLRGLASNTFANVMLIYTGTGATFSVGAIENGETVRLSPDLISSNNDGPGSSSVKFSEMLLSGANSTFGNLHSVYVQVGGTGYDNTDTVSFSGGNTGGGSYTAGNASITTNTTGGIIEVTLSANVGNLITSTPSVSINTSTGSGAELVPLSSLGFIKNPAGDLNFLIIDLLRFSSKTIGTISTLVGINPGENYSADPFVTLVESDIASYGKKDIILEVTGLTAPFITGEIIEQTITTPSIIITGNNYSGNTENNFEIGEAVYATDGISNTGSGIVYLSTLDTSTNTYTVVVTGNTGTFGVGDQLIGVTSNSSIDIITSNSFTSSTLARGMVKTGSNTSTIFVKRISFFTEFDTAFGPITGKTSSLAANITSVSIDFNSRTIGDNANVTANVVSSSGSINRLEVVDSGFGYEQDETLDIISLDGQRVATGKANIIKQGIGSGYYSSSRGFLDDKKYIHDGEYYQNFSYEIQTSIPLAKYSSILKDVMHVAGKKYFGKISTQSEANLVITSTSSITTT